MPDDIVEGNDVTTEAPASDEASDLAAAEAPSTKEAAPDYSGWTTEDYVSALEKARRESGDRRHRLKAYDDAFGGMHPDLASEVLELASAISKGKDGAGVVNRIVADWAGQLGLTKAEVKEVVAEATDDGDVPLTKAALEKALADFAASQAEKEGQTRAQREADAERARVAEAIRAKVKELGYSQDTSKDRRAYAALYGIAQDLREESFGKLDAVEAIQMAHEELDALRSQHVEEYREGKRQDARRIATPTTAAVTATKDTTPTEWDQASRNVRARVAAAQRSNQ